MLYKSRQLEYLVNGVSQVSTLSLIRFIGGKLYSVSRLSITDASVTGRSHPSDASDHGTSTGEYRELINSVINFIVYKCRIVRRYIVY